MRNADYPGGVAVDPVPITENEEVTILYNGLLAKPGGKCVSSLWFWPRRRLG